MKKLHYSIFILLLLMLGIITWVIIMHDYRIIFPIILFFLLIVTHWYIKKWLKAIKDINTVFYNENKYLKKFNLHRIIVPITLFLLIISNIFYFQYEHFYIIVISFFLVSMIINILILSPKSIVFDNSGIRYHIFWKVKWDNIKKFQLNENTLIIICNNNKKRSIKHIKNKDIDNIKETLNSKLIK